MTTLAAAGRRADPLRWATYGTSAVGLVAFVGLGVLLVVESLPVFRAQGLGGYLFGTTWFYRGQEFGVLPMVYGTVVVAAIALALAGPVGVGTAVFVSEALPPRLRLAAKTAVELLAGVPSVVYGLLGVLLLRDWVYRLLAPFDPLSGDTLLTGGLLLAVMILPTVTKSWLAGGLVLGLMILPTVAVALGERMAAVPGASIEAARGLGLTRSRVARSVVLPQSLGGLFSGALLGLARAAGETAPILFTAAVFTGATVPDGVRESPVLALPYHIFVLAQDSLDPGSAERLWGAAAVLLGLVFSLALAALPLRLRAHEEARHG